MRTDLIESELLLYQYRRGDSSALEKLVGLWERPLYSYVRHLLGQAEDAKDLSQEIWVHVFRKVDSLRDPAAFPAWLYKMARNHVAGHARGRRFFDPFSEETGSHVPEDETELAINAADLQWGLSQLSAPHRECLILHYLEGFSIQEIASITGAGPGTVKSRLHYAKKALRMALEQEEQQNGKG